MDKVIGLIIQRNQLLEKYMSLNNAELHRLGSGDFDGLDQFYRGRETILEMVQRVENSLQEQVGFSTATYRPTFEEKQLVTKLLKHKNEIVTEILEQDLEIISLIERAKSEIIDELASLRRSRRLASAYHSGTPRQILDEEA